MYCLANVITEASVSTGISNHYAQLKGLNLQQKRQSTASTV